MKALQNNSLTLDPCTEYAHSIVNGDIVSGPDVINACARHLRDLETANHRGWTWKPEKVDRIISYFKHVLKLNGGQFEGIPFNVLGWQAFILGSIFGWVDKFGNRRFKVAYIETAKGSGKSPLAAGIGLYGLTSDDEPRAEIYAAATKKDQAMILFRDAVAMRDLSPDLSKRLAKSGRGEQAWNLAFRASGGFFRPISADDGQSGPRPHFTLLDEIHEHKNGNVVEMLKAGQKFRRQPLSFMITNSGTDKKLICWEYHEYAQNVSAGTIEDDTFFGYVCSLDDGDNPFKDESCWLKVNPSLEAGIPGHDYIRQQVREAQGMPSKESIVKRLNFCIWTESDNAWIGKAQWVNSIDKDFDEDLLINRPCYGGLDLSSTTDLTAFTLLFEPTDLDKYWRLKSYFWLPESGLAEKEKKDKVPYTVWRDKGYLDTPPGKAINKSYVASKISSLSSTYDIVSIAYDRWRIEDFTQLIENDGINLPDLIPFGQGFKDMSPAVETFEALLINSEIRVDGNPVMTWCASNGVTVEDPAGNRKLSKEKATGRIDGLVSAVMSASISKNKQSVSVYESRGVRQL